MNYLQVVFLYLLKAFNGSRSIYGAYHILKGKKSSQTLQDCQLFEVEKFFGIYKQLDRATVTEIISFFERIDVMTSCGENRFVLTLKGKSLLKEELLNQPFPAHLNGFQYKDFTELFWARLALLTQCLSHLTANNNSFSPIVRDAKTQLWVKNILKKRKITELSNQLYSDLEKLLINFPDLDAFIFVMRLSGQHRTGLTIEQVAQQLKLDTMYVHIVSVSSIHRIIEIIKEDITAYPVVAEIVSSVDVHSLLTESAQKTYLLLEKGYAISEISSLRGLKENTIEDHIVEIVLNNREFDIDRFVSKNKQEAIEEVVKSLKTRRLKEIKQELDETVSYFDIRLTIAMKGLS